MVCPNCKHELNPQARVCPTCGTPVPGARPVPTVVVTPPVQGGPAPEPLRKKNKVTASRVFIVLFCLVAMAANGALIAFWFLPSIRVVGGVAEGSASSITLYSMFDITRGPAPYLTYALIAECIISIVFCMIPLFKKFANRRQMLIVPKVMCLLSAACYATPYLAARIVLQVNALLKGGQVSHVNPFTAICLGLFLLLWLTGELTIRNRRLHYERQIEALRDQLNSYGIKPNV